MFEIDQKIVIRGVVTVAKRPPYKKNPFLPLPNSW